MLELLIYTQANCESESRQGRWLVDTTQAWNVSYLDEGDPDRTWDQKCRALVKKCNDDEGTEWVHNKIIKNRWYENIHSDADFEILEYFGMKPPDHEQTINMDIYNYYDIKDSGGNIIDNFEKIENATMFLILRICIMKMYMMKVIHLMLAVLLNKAVLLDQTTGM